MELLKVQADIEEANSIPLGTQRNSSAQQFYLKNELEIDNMK